MFGPICNALEITSRKVGTKSKKRPPKPGQDRRRKAPVIEANSFELITTADISSFIAGRMASRGLAPKTANRYREILMRLFTWAMEQRGIRMPRDKNPAAAVDRYRESAPVIHFLTLEQIDAQLTALEGKPQLQAMVATYIFAGVRREELLWLTHDDIDWNARPNGINRLLEDWAKLIGDVPAATAILDRFLQHAQILSITGKSYRLPWTKRLSSVRLIRRLVSSLCRLWRQAANVALSCQPSFAVSRLSFMARSRVS